MKKRIMAAILLMATLFSLTAPMVNAITPADPLIASALYSYVASSGIRLFRDSTDLSNAEQLEDDMKDLWSKYTTDSFSSLGEGITVSGGKFIFNYVILPQVQGFVDWIASNYSLIPNEVTPLSEGGIGSVGVNEYSYSGDVQLPGYDNGVWAMPIQTGGPPVQIIYPDWSKRAYTFIGNCIIFKATSTNDNGRTTQLICLSSNPFEINYVEEREDGSLVASGSVQVTPGSVTYGGIQTNYFIAYIQTISTNNITPILPINYFQPSNYQSLNEMIWVILNGSIVREDGLFASVGSTVLDLTYDLARDKSQGIAVDIGIGANATEDDLTAAVADSFIGTQALESVKPVAMPIPIEGVAELYPQAGTASDVDDLGLPALGQALTTRFPFCIPWDVVYLYQSLNAKPERPTIEIDLFPSDFKQKVGIMADTSFTLDFGDAKYEMLLKIVRWSTLFGFIIALAFATKRLIWTTGG